MHFRFYASIVLLSTFSASAFAQVGGKTSADGPFMLEDVEDLNLNAAGVNREWIHEFSGYVQALHPVDPAAEGLTLAAGQSPQGVLLYRAVPEFGFVSKTFGVPLPSELGMSTLTHPGDLTSFTTMSFLGSVNQQRTNLEFQVVLECYPQNPDSSFPTLFWNFMPPTGTTFGNIELDLRQPTLSENTGTATIEELLSQTRFLSFFIYAGFLPTTDPIDFHVDDIRFQGVMTDASSWNLYE